MITPQSIEQIKNRIDIIEVLGDYIKLKKRGSNYLGLCPFHNEKSPSFTVSPAKELYKCFGCGKSGNTITFLMEHDKLSYVEALRWLAARYNIEIEETETSPEQKILVQTSDSLYAINHFAQKFFSTQLLDSEEGKNIALSYLQERGFRKEIIEKFQIGYNPDSRTALTEALIANQFNPTLLPKTGLVSNRNGDELVDNYRGRIIFPIHGNTGKVIGFGARVIGKSDRGPKYINTPENEVYSKSKILYGSYFARMAIDKADECLLVEGYTDVISMYQAGIENVVASSGTSLTVEQSRLVRRYTENVTVLYDGDSAGIKASLRGIEILLEEGLNVRVALFPDKEDPDSFVRKVGALAFQEFIKANTKDFVTFKAELYLEEIKKDPLRKAEVAKEMVESIAKMPDVLKRSVMIQETAALIGLAENVLMDELNRVLLKKKKQQYTTSSIE